jgi:hypothetical protein
MRVVQLSVCLYPAACLPAIPCEVHSPHFSALEGVVNQEPLLVQVVVGTEVAST